MCCACCYYPCNLHKWASYGLFHSIKILPWQSTLSNQNICDNHWAAADFLRSSQGHACFEAAQISSPKSLRKFTLKAKPCLEFPAMIPFQPLVGERAFDGRMVWRSLGGDVFLGSLCEGTYLYCMYGIFSASVILIRVFGFFMQLESFTRAWGGEVNLHRLVTAWDSIDTLEEARNSERSLQSSVPSWSYLNPCQIGRGGAQKTGWTWQ